MAKIERRREKSRKSEATDIEEYLKQLPLPPEEHAYELKMEKRLKRMIEEYEKKAKKNSS